MNALDIIVAELQERVKHIQDWISSGQAKDFTEYQKMVGKIQGLLSAKEYITDLKQNMENSDE
jgi:hypothetical protein